MQATTSELLDKFGNEPMTEGSETFREAFEAAKDGNERYRVRVKLLVRAGELDSDEAVKLL